MVSISVTSRDLLNTTLVSPENTVKAHRQSIQIPGVAPDGLPARKQLYGPSDGLVWKTPETAQGDHRPILIRIAETIPTWPQYHWFTTKDHQCGNKHRVTTDQPWEQDRGNSLTWPQTGKLKSPGNSCKGPQTDPGRDPGNSFTEKITDGRF